MPPMVKKKLGDYLIQCGLITEAELRVAESEKNRWGGNLPRALIELDFVEEKKLIPRLGQFLNVPTVCLADVGVNEDTVKLFPEDVCRRDEFVVFRDDGRFLHVAMTDPNNPELFDQLRVKTQRNIRTFLAGPGDVQDALSKALRGTVALSPELQFSLMNESLLQLGEDGAEEPEEPALDATDDEERESNTIELEAEEAPRAAAAAPPPPADSVELAEFMRRTDAFLHALAWHLTTRGLLPPGLVEGQIVPYPGGLRSTAAAAPGPSPALRELPPPARSSRPPSTQMPPQQDRPQAEWLQSSLDQLVEQTGVEQGSTEERAEPPTEEPAPLVEEPAPPPPPAPPPAPKAVPTAIPPAPRRVSPAPVPAVGDLIVDRPPDEEEITGVGFKPRGPDQQTPAPAKAVVQSAGADRSAASGEIGGAKSKDPSAVSSAVLLELPDFSGEPVVAIDFGTTRSSVAILMDAQVRVLKLPKVAILRLPGGEWDMPSVVAFRTDGSVMLGESARKLLATEPQHVITSPKRLLGRKYDDPAIQPLLANLAVGSEAGEDGEVVLSVRKQTISVVECCAHIMHLLKLVAQRNLNTPVRDVVLTVPVTFGEAQLDALRRAAQAARLEVVGFIDEPLAAALSNRYDEQCRGLVAVYDFGGGTFDFSVVSVEREGVRVVAKGGDAWLGGDDFDETLAAAAANAFWRQTKIELRNNATQWQRLRHAAEVTKRELSSRSESVLKVGQVARSAKGVLSLSFPMNRATLAKLCGPLIERSLEACRTVLKEAQVGPEDLSAVYLSGGTSLIPAVQNALLEFFGKVPRSAVPPERAVIVGAALYPGHLRES
jgi:actin-like ATPase involved in cell morphogenesis